MPIRPSERSKYPSDWKAIRARIMARARNRCEWPGCGVPNGAVIYRRRDEPAAWCNSFEPASALAHYTGPIRVVLTVAHVHNPDPADCRPENLLALCQRCHNVLDMPMRQKNASATRRRKRLERQPELPWP